MLLNHAVHVLYILSNSPVIRAYALFFSAFSFCTRSLTRGLSLTHSRYVLACGYIDSVCFWS